MTDVTERHARILERLEGAAIAHGGGDFDKGLVAIMAAIDGYKQLQSAGRIVKWAVITIAGVLVAASQMAESIGKLVALWGKR